ncbi:Conidiation protein 6-domain-containing protein [Echria macrotheca]|uniref:Conidiation protein 6-domain-containing protein n=1 Tax=Echria macrotheca TaxID=438768 RepID=A0AAJ0F717_9PEZI|nr:Conidiation protein 6-domain-containing protein [Echria macrotheca]
MAERGNRERGLKAALHNPRVSEEAKQRDREILETEFGEHFEKEPDMSSSPDIPEESADPIRFKQTIGLRSSTSGEESSSKGKTRSSSAGARSSGLQDEGKDPENVIRGLKAAISNPNVSEKAKEKDREKLRDLGEPVD